MGFLGLADCCFGVLGRCSLSVRGVGFRDVYREVSYWGLGGISEHACVSFWPRTTRL